MEANSTFGSALFKNNTGGKLSGSGNSGFIIDCTNLNLSATNCKLSILETSDTSVDASNSLVNFARTTSSSIDGNHNAIDFQRIHNANFVGSDNQIDASDSSDSNFKTEKSNIWVTHAKNCNISTKSMEIKLHDSYNVCVNGDGGVVRIHNAYNQTITRLSSAGETIQSCIKFTKCDNVAETANAAGEGFMKLTEDLKKLKISTTFVCRFRLSEEGTFNIDGWTVMILPRKEDLPLDVYEVFISSAGDSLDQTLLGPSEVELIATAKGKKHVLKFEAPEIVQHSGRYGTSGVYFRL